MAYTRIQTIGRYEGVSTDTKPTDNIKEGSQLHELDTGKRFIMVDGNWKEDTSGPISESVFNTAQSTLRRLEETEAVASNYDIGLDTGHYNFIENR